MSEGIKISELPASLTPALDYIFPAIRNGVTERLTLTQVSELVLALVVDGSPEALDTLNELAAALGDDANFSATVTAALAARLKLDGSTPMTGPLNLGGQDIQNVANMVGMVGLFLGNSPPPGWLKLNGATLSRTSYAALWAYANASGNTVAEASWSANWGKFSTGDGSTTFRIPDLRGEFMRLWDDGRGIDSGRTIGSSQLDALQNITGSISWHGGGVGTPVHAEDGAFGRMATNNSYAAASIVGGADSAYVTIFDASRVARTDAETRPRSIAVLACIKF